MFSSQTHALFANHKTACTKSCLRSNSQKTSVRKIPFPTDVFLKHLLVIVQADETFKFQPFYHKNFYSKQHSKQNVFVN